MATGDPLKNQENLHNLCMLMGMVQEKGEIDKVGDGGENKRIP